VKQDSYGSTASLGSVELPRYNWNCPVNNVDQAGRLQIYGSKVSLGSVELPGYNLNCPDCGHNKSLSHHSREHLSWK
jgi:hypothetical protein